MKANITIPTDKMIPLTYARRNLGELVRRLKVEGELYLMRSSKVAAKLSLPEMLRSEEREKVLNDVFGAWKHTELDNDMLWEKILVKERVRATKKKSLSL